ncbi:MAG: hypothetical protein A3B30_04165 [Candidatus Komeilibacteria bacterium RIFCSPLOWO2_01_FULL_52_15]|uniref:Rod shape-determining protein MreD n=2 Tax=Candidatus Komeiliibacteriota TaxID=1817908 RepID=A0A1G2BS97_9BACT|nr:MAG: hypothetical protein A2677_01055 [Candidatus Komeilibacteria bacterium RIFCSPHIGHO2_01_FULL_52_14]OGY91270.1 MAG: hypothetical protein A3B30_04165 [Candidatus Komeilibacteria bacterium RIFCSPLOWO2_01_FULL_52_15]
MIKTLTSIMFGGAALIAFFQFAPISVQPYVPLPFFFLMISTMRPDGGVYARSIFLALITELYQNPFGMSLTTFMITTVGVVTVIEGLRHVPFLYRYAAAWVVGSGIYIVSHLLLTMILFRSFIAPGRMAFLFMVYLLAAILATICVQIIRFLLPGTAHEI